MGLAIKFCLQDSTKTLSKFKPTPMDSIQKSLIHLERGPDRINGLWMSNLSFPQGLIHLGSVATSVCGYKDSDVTQDFYDTITSIL